MQINARNGDNTRAELRVFSRRFFPMKCNAADRRKKSRVLGALPELHCQVRLHPPIEILVLFAWIMMDLRC